MRIEDEVKLDFKDVLIRPKRSTLSSRREVDLNRTYTFKHSKQEWTGIPVMASNMDGVGTLEIAESISKSNLFTCLVKSYTEEDVLELVRSTNSNYFTVSTGTGEKDFQKLQRIVNSVPEVNFICIDLVS